MEKAALIVKIVPIPPLLFETFPCYFVISRLLPVANPSLKTRRNQPLKRPVSLLAGH
jgi:hypothetical protein